MPSHITLLLFGLTVAMVAFLAAWWRSAAAGHPHGLPMLPAVGLGAVTLFFDTLGIGSYAPMTAAFKFLGMVRDELIPGTLNVGEAVPVAIEAYVFINAIAVDPLTLFLLIPIGALGGYLGARIVSRLPRRRIQLGIGAALLVGAAMMLMTNMHWIPGGGSAIGFSGPTLVLALTINFVLGGLNSLGIGNYAPSLIAFSLMGLDPRAAFPIMMGSGACMQAMAGVKFVKEGKYDGRVALGLTLGGIPGVLVAAYIVKSLPLTAIRWLVVGVVLYAALSLLAAGLARREPRMAVAVDAG